MANMSYRRFQNTLKDLKDCLEHMEDVDLSVNEAKARLKLVTLCSDIAQDFDDYINFD